MTEYVFGWEDIIFKNCIINKVVCVTCDKRTRMLADVDRGAVFTTQYPLDLKGLRFIICGLNDTVFLSILVLILRMGA